MGEFCWCEVADRKGQIKSSDSKKFHDKCQQNDHMHASWEKVRNESQRDRAMMELPMANPPTTQPMSDLPTDVSVPVTALEDFEDTHYSLRRYSTRRKETSRWRLSWRPIAGLRRNTCAVG